jgi:RNA polymerase sigma factor (sigma-70 family)
MTHTSSREPEERLDRATEHDLIRRAQRGDGAALEALLRSHERFVGWIAGRHRTPAVEFDDLLQAGRLGLIRAIEKFDCGTGHRLATYAGRWVEGEIQEAVRDGFLIPLPGKKAALLPRVDKARQRLTSRLGRVPSLEEVAAEAGVPKRTVFELAEVAAAVVSGLKGDYVPMTRDQSDPPAELDRDTERPGYTEAEVGRLLDSYAELWGGLEGTRSKTTTSARRTKAYRESNLQMRLLDLERAIERLPDDLYQAIEAVKLEGLREEEAAPWLGVHPNTVRNRCRRAVSLMTEYLNGETSLGPRRKRPRWRSELQAIESIAQAVRIYPEILAVLTADGEADEWTAKLEVGWIKKGNRWEPVLSHDIRETVKRMGATPRPLPASVRERMTKSCERQRLSGTHASP